MLKSFEDNYNSSAGVILRLVGIDKSLSELSPIGKYICHLVLKMSKPIHLSRLGPFIFWAGNYGPRAAYSGP